MEGQIEGAVALTLVVQLLAILEKQPQNKDILERMIQALEPREGVIELADAQAPAHLAAARPVALHLLQMLKSGQVQV